MKPFLFLLASLVISAPVGAQSIPDHTPLFQALQQVGVRLYNNSNRCAEQRGLDGFWVPRDRALVLCNQGSWDLDHNAADTLRHEAIHVIQDCRKGSLGDGALTPVLSDDTVVAMANRRGINLQHTLTPYKGASNHTLRIEAEAFAAAADLHPNTIADGIRQFCK